MRGLNGVNFRKDHNNARSEAKSFGNWYESSKTNFLGNFMDIQKYLSFSIEKTGNYPAKSNIDE
ncbi:MAG: hypothetical protein KAT43_01585 [Nanoarchaeota archaeon]|nr:hypothetical protein [Nanoarchaeota archaeon]